MSMSGISAVGGMAGLSTCSQVPPVPVGQSEPVFQQATAFGGFRVGSLVQGAEVRAVSRWGNLRSEDYNVEMLALPLIF